MVATAPTRFSRMALRALLVRCPRCGSRRTFIRRWLGKHERCQTCGIKWCREEGFELGPMALNIAITFALLAVGMLVGFIVTSPDIAVGPLILILGAIAVVVPLAIYPICFALWLAFDLAVRPPEPVEEADAATWVAATGGRQTSVGNA